MAAKNEKRSEFLIGEVEEQKLRIEKLRIDLENEKRKGENLAFEKTKLQQETSFWKSKFVPGILPSFQILASLLLVIVTWKIGFSDSKNQIREAQERKNLIDSETIMIENEGILNKNQNEIANYKLLKEGDSLRNKKAAIVIENASLYKSKDSLLVVRNQLDSKINNLQAEKRQIGYSLNSSKVQLQALMKSRADVEEELSFLIFKYALESAVRFPSTLVVTTDTLITEIKRNSIFKDRIISSLRELSDKKEGGLYGYAYYVIYMGTKDSAVKNTLFQSISNLIGDPDTTFFKYIDLANLFASDLWSKTERMEIASIIIKRIDKHNSNPLFITYLFKVIADIQNDFDDINLWDNYPDLYLKYLNVAKFVATNNDTSNYVHYEMARNFAIMCPQYFLAKQNSNAYGVLQSIRDNKKTISSKEYNSDGYMTIPNNIYQNTFARIQKLQSLDTSKKIPTEFVYKDFKRYMKKYKKEIDFWLHNDFDDTPENRQIIIEKVRNGVF